MRFDTLPASLLSLLALSLLQPVSAGLIPDLIDTLEDLHVLSKRCDNPCGYNGWLCCASGESCFTNGLGQAQCGAGGAAVTQVAAQGNGAWQFYTTTYVQTDLKTVTATFSSFIAAQTSSCSYAQGQTPCGNTCCLSGQYCAQAGSCVAVPGSSGYYSGLATVTVTNTASAPLRPTTNAITTLTATGGASTVPFQAPAGTGGAILTGPQAQEGGGGGGLSGGAIAGIVIGVIAAIIILLLLCLCCCAKGLLDTILGFFGLGGNRRRRREEVEVYEERHHHAGGGGRRTWFGTRPGHGSNVSEKKKKKESGLGGLAKAGVFLAGLAAILGFKRSRDHRDDKSGSGYSYSYYDSEYTSSSSSSSAGRTRGSRSRSRSRI